VHVHVHAAGPLVAAYEPWAGAAACQVRLRPLVTAVVTGTPVLHHGMHNCRASSFILSATAGCCLLPRTGCWKGSCAMSDMLDPVIGVHRFQVRMHLPCFVWLR
jgi:hypothetical protein